MPSPLLTYLIGQPSCGGTWKARKPAVTLGAYLQRGAQNWELLLADGPADLTPPSGCPASPPSSACPSCCPTGLHPQLGGTTLHRASQAHTCNGGWHSLVNLQTAVSQTLYSGCLRQRLPHTCTLGLSVRTVSLLAPESPEPLFHLLCGRWPGPLMLSLGFVTAR